MRLIIFYIVEIFIFYLFINFVFYFLALYAMYAISDMIWKDNDKKILIFVYNSTEINAKRAIYF